MKESIYKWTMRPAHQIDIGVCTYWISPCDFTDFTMESTMALMIPACKCVNSDA